ncbi:MAG: YdaU family protein [Acidobacteriota bacterium]|nr:YdaU family protein [Acidobacteriota bacterium]
MPKDNSAPAFLFYPDDFSSDGKVEAMTTQEVGACILLLCKAWREDPPGSIPNNDLVLSRWARLTPEAWAECRAGVLAAFALGMDDRWHQKRLRREYDKLQALNQRRSSAGKVAAKKRWHQQDSTKGMAKVSGSHTNRKATAMRKRGIPSSSSSPVSRLKVPGSEKVSSKLSEHTHSTSKNEKGVCVSKSKFSFEQNLQYAWAAYNGDWGVKLPDAWAAANFSNGKYDELVETYLADPGHFRATGTAAR